MAQVLMVASWLIILVGFFACAWVDGAALIGPLDD